jgi:hypothetical protein
MEWGAEVSASVLKEFIAMEAEEVKKTGMDICVVCGKEYEPAENVIVQLTCSKECHDKLVESFIARFGEYKKVIRAGTGEAFRVPIRDIIEKGISEQTLDKYPKWKEEER